MSIDTYLEIARPIMGLPTASYHEHFIAAAVAHFVAQRPLLRLKADPYGNLHLLYDQRKNKKRRQSYLVATAHMDHPGAAYLKKIRGHRYLFEKLGGVDTDLVVGATVNLYCVDRPADQGPAKGRIHRFLKATKERPDCFEVEAPPTAGIGPGTFAMWDVPIFRRRGDFLWARACDDLAGLAAGLTYLDRLCNQRPAVKAGLLLTRAEEVGFGGMLAAVRHGRLDKNATYINLECSSIKAGAQAGAGPIIRVGDRWWIFDPYVTGGLVAIAEDLQRKSIFRFQRKLMDSGICEATVLMSAGYTTGAAALPLKNYHNIAANGLRAEGIHLDDAVGLVELLYQLAQRPDGLVGARQAEAQLESALDRRFQLSVHRLKNSASLGGIVSKPEGRLKDDL